MTMDDDARNKGGATTLELGQTVGCPAPFNTPFSPFSMMKWPKNAGASEHWLLLHDDCVPSTQPQIQPIQYGGDR